jgi:hypothetical protein
LFFHERDKKKKIIGEADLKIEPGGNYPGGERPGIRKGEWGDEWIEGYGISPPRDNGDRD